MFRPVTRHSVFKQHTIIAVLFNPKCSNQAPLSLELKSNISWKFSNKRKTFMWRKLQREDETINKTIIDLNTSYINFTLESYFNQTYSVEN